MTAGLFAGAPTDRRLLTPQFWILLTASSVYFLGAGILNALYPTYVVDELGGTESTAGLVMGSFAVSALVTRPFVGRHADRSGARPVMVFGAVFGAIAMFVIETVGGLTGAIASRLLLGVSGAAMITAATVLALDLAPANRRSEAASYVLVSVHVGLGIGPLIGERVVAATSYGVVWIVVAGVFLTAGLGLQTLEHRPGGQDDQPSPLVHPAAIGPGLVTFFGVFGFNGFLVFLPLYAREIGLDAVGLVFATASLSLVAVRLALSHVPDRVGPVRAGSGALVVSLLASAVLVTWMTPMGAFVAAALLAGGLSLQAPSFIAIAVDGVSDRERGSATATFTGFFDVANAVNGPMIGLIVAGVGYRVAFTVAGLMSLVALAILHMWVAPRWHARSI